MSILEGIRDGELTDDDAFGSDPGWKLFYMGFCQLYVGAAKDARATFSEFLELDLGPHANLDWAREREQYVNEALTRLAT